MTFRTMWARESTAGETVQKIEAGLDMCQIVKEGHVGLGRQSLGAVRTELEVLDVDLGLETIAEVRRGDVKFRLQAGEKGTLLRNPKLGSLIRFHLGWLTRRPRGRGFVGQ